MQQPPGNKKWDESGGYVLGQGEMRNAYKISADKSRMINVLVGDPVEGKVLTITVDRTHIVCGYDLARTGRAERHIIGFLITK